MKKTKHIVLCAFFAALTGILSQLTIPIGPIPVNLATLSVFCAGAILGSRYGALSQIIYVLLGAVGLPIFSMFRGGVGAIIGPTGGYILGYAVAAWSTGFLIEKSKNVSAQVVIPLSMCIGFLLCLFMGTSWFMFSTKTTLWESLIICVFPFLLGDIVKIVVATWLTKRLRGFLRKNSNS